MKRAHQLPDASAVRQAPRRKVWAAAILFVLLAALAGETAELLRLRAAGWNAASWELRATLFLSYGLLGAACGLAGWLVGRSRDGRLGWATMFATLVVSAPWLNFDYLPRLWSVSTLAGNLLLFTAAAPVAWLIVRLRKAAAVSIFAAAVAANLPGDHSARTGAVDRAVADAGRSPNVLIILIDTLRADHLGAYGYGRPTSPHIDRLASEGVLFENATTQAPWTKPAVASLLTGVFPHEHGVMSKRAALARSPATMAEAFQRHGFRTAAFSASPWITPEFNFDRGFDHFDQTARASGIQNTLLFRLSTRVDRIGARLGHDPNIRGVLRRRSEVNPGNAERDSMLVSRLIEWIAEHRDQPFFAYVHLMGAHNPYDPPARFVAAFRDPGWGGRTLPKNPPPQVHSTFERAAPLDADTRRMLIAQYDASIAFADHQVARIVSALREVGALQRTLLVITADHGEEFYEHGNWGHGHIMYRETLRVPLIMHYPDRLPAARRAEPVMLVDIFPTLAGIAGLAADDGSKGRDLFAGHETGRDVVSEYYRDEGGTYEAIALFGPEGYKFIYTRDSANRRQRAELYHLESDPSETTDLIHRVPAVAQAAVARWRNAMSSLRAAGPGHREAAASKMTQSTSERLRQLGY